MYSLSLTLCRCVATLRDAFFGASLNGTHFFNIGEMKMKRVKKLFLAICIILCLSACSVDEISNNEMSGSSLLSETADMFDEEPGSGSTNEKKQDGSDSDDKNGASVESNTESVSSNNKTVSEKSNAPSTVSHTSEANNSQKSKTTSAINDSNKTNSTQSSQTQPVDTAKQQALKKAKSYIGMMAFSYEGLIEQLEYERFTTEQAKYGADNCGANWNQQALKKAKSYLGINSFSYNGLIGQLEYEKFTTEQAKYGADNCGANWNEQAAKKAKSYLDMMSFSKDELISQLIYEGFTKEQANYGATANGF